MSQYTKHGGEWLGAARRWVKRRCHNGSHVTWGSNDELRPPLTIGQVEELAAAVADAANREMDTTRAQLGVCRKARLREEINLTVRAEKAEKEAAELRAELVRVAEVQALRTTCVVCSASLLVPEAVPHCFDCLPDEEQAEMFLDALDAMGEESTK